MTRYLFFLMAFAAQGFEGYSQDANYWSSAYGNGSFFMPGAVVSYNGDSGVLFRNPALQGYNRHASASITGTVYQFQSFAVKNGVGDGLDLVSNRTNIVPLVVSNSLPLKTKKPVSIVYAILSQPTINFLANQRKEAAMEVLDDGYSPGAEVFIGQYSLSKNMFETSALLSAGMVLDKKWAIGATVEAVNTFIHYLADVKARALQNTHDPAELFPPVVSAEEFYEVTARHSGVRLKGGISFLPSSRHSLGLLISSPLWRVAGTARLLSDVEINDVRIAGLYPLSLLASTYQSGLKTQWKMPVSIAGGYTYRHGKGQLYIAAEYFGRVKAYDMVAPRNEAFLRPDTSNRITYSSLRLKDGRQSLVNIAAGASYDIGERSAVYLSARSDFSYSSATAFNNDEGYVFPVTHTNIYHAQIGANVKRTRFNLRTGLLLSYGKTNHYRQKADFDHPSEDNLLMGDPSATSARLLSVGMVFSYIHNF